MQGVSHFPMILLLLTIILAQIPEQNAADQLVRVLGQGTCLAVPNRLASASKNMAALWLRATFHAAGTWKPNDPIQGGFDDLLIQTASLKENTGLEESLAHQFVSGVSNSDSLAIAGIVAVQHCGGPQIRFASGRKDKKQRSFLANRIPTAFQNYDLIKSKLKEMGWNDEDIVALATGSHTLGGAHRENSPSLTDQPFVPFDDTPGIFDNNIFKFSLQGKCIIQFDCDVANDPELRPIVQRFADNQQAFFDQYSKSFQKMLEQTPEKLSNPTALLFTTIHPLLFNTSQPIVNFPTASNDNGLVDSVSMPLNPSAFRHQVSLYKASDYHVQLLWNVAGDDWDVSLQLDSLQHPLNGSWIGLGIGTGMLKATQMFVCGSSQQGVTFREHIPPTTYVPPSISSPKAVTQSAGKQTATSFTCSFKRKLLGSTPIVEGPMNFIFAFNPKSGINFQRIYFTQHKTQHKGHVIVNLATGSIQYLGVATLTKKHIHGVGMMVVWMVMFPFGAYLARYMKSVITKWLIVKIVNQVTGTLFMFLFLYFIVSAGVSMEISKPHNVLGVVMISVIAFQVFMGVLSHLGLRWEVFDEYRVYTRRAHFFIGYGMLIIGIVQVGLGIHTLYPINDSSDGIAFWAVYFTLISIWIITFVSTEMYWRHRVSSIAPLLGKMSSQTKLVISSKNPNPKYTWQKIDEQVKRGALLVVANGKYVYDMSKWLTNHPGGQIILHTVNGTDITNDYFNESGYDAEQFTPQAPAPRRPSIPQPLPQVGLSRADLMSMNRRSSVTSKSKLGKLKNISDQEWIKVRKARRTHVHTRLAIERLADMIVGELDQVSDLGSINSKSTLVAESDITFDAFEYRRYAIVSTARQEDSHLGPVIKVKFCLVYPFDIRVNQPIAFLPGQYVELQARLPSGDRITRQYYPINGDMTSFEILIQMKSNGKMSQFLMKQQAGERQIKIRGPFGDALPTALEHKETIHFVVDGVGITPLLQFLHSYYLTVGMRAKVHQSYVSNLPDELTISENDQVKIQQHYWDGWCFGINATTHKSGSFPVGCTVPLLATVIIVHIVDPTMGMEILKAMELSFPSLFQLEFGLDGLESLILSESTSLVISGSQKLHDQVSLINESCIHRILL